jgi:hypothetical protein
MSSFFITPITQNLPVSVPAKNTIATVATKLASVFSPTNLNQATTKIMSQIAAAGGLARPSRYRVYLNASNILATAGIQTANLQTNNIVNGLASGLAAVGSLSAGSIIGAVNAFTNKYAALDLSGRLTLFCDQAEFPGRTFSTTDVRHYGPTYKQPYQSTYSDITLRFLVGDDMAEKYFFDAWHTIIESPKTQNFSYFNDYITTIEIDQVSDSPDVNQNDVTYVGKMYSAWPIGIDRLTLDYSDTDRPHRLSVSFAYRRWVNDQFDFETGSSSSSSVNSFKGTSS